MDMSPSLSMAGDYMSTFVTSRLVIANPKTSHQEGGKVQQLHRGKLMRQLSS